MEEDILKGKTLLVVDDENDLRDIVSSELEFMGAKVFQAENIASAQEVLKQNKIDLIISDIRMPGGTGVDLLDVVKTSNTNTPAMILITGFADITLEDAFDKGAEALIHKPFKLDDLIKLAVRYTSSFNERFHEPVEAQKTIHALAEEKDVHFGRGGLSLPIETVGKRIDVGEAVNFDFDYNDQHFSGRGICRWLKAEPGSNKAYIGLEFMDLAPESLDYFKHMFDGKKVIPYIPAVRA